MNSMRINITEEQLHKILLKEESNPYYDRKSSRSQTNLKKIWELIDQKQEDLQQTLFGINKDIDDLTKAKAKLYGLKRNDLQIPIKLVNVGNKKLPKNVLYINLTSALACPSYYLGTCLISQGNCYAQRDENQYDNTRIKNTEYDIMTTELLRRYEKGEKEPMKKFFRLIELYLQIGNAAAKNVFKRNLKVLENQLRKKIEDGSSEWNTLKIIANQYRITDIRLNGSGDFPCQLAFDLWNKFANKVGKKYHIYVHAYTARKLDFSNRNEFMSVMPSRKDINIGDEPYRRFWVVNDEKYDSFIGKGETKEYGVPILRYDEKLKTWYFKCRCSKQSEECGNCGVCYRRNRTGKPYTIIVRYHGQNNAHGLKSAFTQDEIKDCIEQSIKLGWVTPQEVASYNSQETQVKNANWSEKVMNQRKEAEKRKNKKNKKS